MLLLRTALVFAALTCISRATPINSMPDIEHLLDPYTLSLLSDTLAFSSENADHSLMRIVYVDDSHRTKHFDAVTVSISGSVVRCSMGLDQIIIDRKRITHMYIIEIT